MDQYLPNVTQTGDDYLNVAVWTPDPTAQNLPVVVWIHGGAFVRGANSIATYDGSAFARDGVVVVGVNYRLGVPGFAVVDGAPTNLGLRDQILALEWVAENVAAFGGDPARVTIMGESAGSMSVATLLGIKRAEGLFTQAIMQSGGGISAAPLDQSREFSRTVARLLGIQPAASEFADVSPEKLLEAQNQASLELATDPSPDRWGRDFLRASFAIMPTIPVIDEDLVTCVPENAIASGAASDVPLLIGTTRSEFNLWTVGLGLNRLITEANLTEQAGRFGAGADVVNSYRSRRPEWAPSDIFSDIVTDALFREPSLRIVESRTRASASTYLYEFDWPTPVAGLGACHALELGFTFDTLASGVDFMGGDTAPQGLADVMHEVWVRFISDGDPGWAPCGADGGTTCTFTADGATCVDLPRRDDHQAWADAR